MKRKIYNIDSLKLTKEQEYKFKKYINLIKYICYKYATDNIVTEFDDLVQISMITIAYLIKNKNIFNIKNEKTFFSTAIRNSCISELRNNKNKKNIMIYDDSYINNKLYYDNIDENIINEDYCNMLLSLLEQFPISDYERKILIHSFGINTYCKTNNEIGKILGKSGKNIKSAKTRAITKIRQNFIKNNKNINTYAS